MKKLNKKQITAISSAGGALLIAAVSFTVWFTSFRNKPAETEVPAQEENTEDTQAPTQAETESESASETKPETSTEKATKAPAAPVTKPFKPKPTKPALKPTAPIKSMKLNVPIVWQVPDYPTGCEAASSTMLLRYYGYNVSLGEMVNAIPREDLYEENGRVYGPSIYEKFVGDPRQTYTDARPGYGAFSPVITRALNNVLAKKGGRHYAKNITGCSFETLLKHIDNGDPVIVWSTSKMRTPTTVNSWYIKGADGKDTYFEYPRGTHVTVLTGYDGKEIYISDPYYGYLHFPYGDFVDKWNLLGTQAIVLLGGAPVTVPPTTESTTKPTTTEPTTESTTESTTETTTNPTTIPEESTPEPPTEETTE